MAVMSSGPARKGAVPLTEFEGVSVDSTHYAVLADRFASLSRDLSRLMREAREQRTDVPAPKAVQQTMAELNGVIAAAGGLCTKSPPPKAIATMMDAGGRLIYQCAHARQHRWDLDGNPLPPGAP